MENDMNIKEYTSNIYDFAHFVSDMESWVAYSEKISDCWEQLEILNASALDDWEQVGKPIIWKEWNNKYKHSAIDLSRKLFYEIESFIDSKARIFSDNFDDFSKFLLEIGKDDYIKQKYHNYYRKLEDIYFLILASDDDWGVYQPEIFQIVKEMLNSTPHILLKYK